MEQNIYYFEGAVSFTGDSEALRSLYLVYEQNTKHVMYPLICHQMSKLSQILHEEHVKYQ